MQNIDTGETDLATLLRSMRPMLNDGIYVFCTIGAAMPDTSEIVFFFKEAEGITVVCKQAYADQQNYEYSATFAWITLQVHSSLAAVGLTAAFSQALANHQISCNVVAGYYHDHIFVPTDKATEALRVLTMDSFR
jgi:uncharacterized protein